MNETGLGLSFLLFFGGFYALIMCLSVFFIILGIWLFIACIVDLIKKDEATFPEKTTWLVILIITFGLGLGFIPSVIYFVMYKPKFLFWK